MVVVSVTGTLPPGSEILPGYTVVGLLGHGRRIDTYDVYSELRQCRCVIKAIRPDRLTDDRVREAVLREGAILKDLAHPHLLRGYEVMERPFPAMVLETSPGATLDAVIEDAPLDPTDTAQLGLQLASALNYLHLHGWLHLDVKPANIIVESGRATLIDLSLVARPGPGRPGAGTSGYLAPEQATGKDLSEATDVWGLGVTLIEAVTGQTPFDTTSRWGMRGRLHRPSRRAEQALKDATGLPAEFGDALHACVDVDPRRRPDLDALREHLTPFAQG